MAHSKPIIRCIINEKIGKKGKMSIGPTNCDGDENLEWKNIMDKAEISIKVGNLCEYKCKVCDKCYNSKKSLSAHFIKENHRNMEQGKNLESYLVKAVLHECQLCSKKVMCERRHILNHLLFTHNIKLWRNTQQ